MNSIRLHFVSQEHLNELLNDEELTINLDYLNPNRTGDNFLELTDTVENHNILDTEVVVLTIFAKAIKRVLYSNSQSQIEFLNPIANMQKNGLRHQNLIIIDQTRF
ncbi:hypothetical protein [Tenacibaculum maritimum]|uniref:hypothetical protein n=1 Tax=Tenacibaculum maritimum TaxID=107401 RepID=UPI00132FA472|nr:hypothetical protein [Tenacibaculum maritimum]